MYVKSEITDLNEFLKYIKDFIIDERCTYLNKVQYSPAINQIFEGDDYGIFIIEERRMHKNAMDFPSYMLDLAFRQLSINNLIKLPSKIKNVKLDLRR